MPNAASHASVDKSGEGTNHMTSGQSPKRAARMRLAPIMIALMLPMLLLPNVAEGEHSGPSKGASGMPGATGTMEYKPADWKGNVTTYWKDSDGIAPGVAGCHLGVTKSGEPNGRFFGEACQGTQTLIEANPGAGEFHAHANDLGHPDTFDCKAWCTGTAHTTGGVCKAVTGPAPCAASARCECN